MLESMGKKAVSAKYEIEQLTEEKKNQVLAKVAQGLLEDAEDILKENEKDMRSGKERNMPEGLLDRLLLTKERIEAMAEGMKQVMDLPDPIGEVMEEWERPNGLKLEKRRVPMGVVGIIYEARPNVTADAFALAFKTGNVVILKGGSDAIFSNAAITKSIQKSLESCGITRDAIQLIMDTDRKITEDFMRLNRYVDVLIPRGGAGLISMVVNNSTIPVIETGTGNCHLYIDKEADLEKAIPIVVNAKTQRIGVCNACESLVVHRQIKESFLPLLKKALDQVHPVELRGDEEVREILPETNPAEEKDYYQEYLDYILSIKIVDDVMEAVNHINQYHTKHSDGILTENRDTAELFLKLVDSACCYWNASTRFTDGFEFGFGAEIGISTQKLHARGPMGLKEMTTYKYIIKGDGQIR